LLCFHTNYKLGYCEPHFKTDHMRTFNIVSVKISFLMKHMEGEPFIMNTETNCTSNFFLCVCVCVCVCVLQDVSLCETSFLDGHMKVTDFKEGEGLT
jgi:hypothetical protein